MQEIRVQVNFSRDTSFGTYSDALYFSLEDFDNTTPEQILQMQDDRVNAWIQAITTPPTDDNEVVIDTTPIVEEKE